MDGYVFESRPNRRDEHFYFVGAHPAVNVTMGVLTIARGAPPSPESWDEPDSAAVQIVRFRQRLRRMPLDLAPPVWEDAPGFVPSHHVTHVPVGGTGSLRDLTRAADAVQNEPFRPDRPLWRTVYFTGLSGDRFASLLTFHHVFSDGTAIAAIFSRLLMSALEAEHGGPLVRFQAAAPPGGQVHEAVRHLRENGPEAARALGAALRDAARGGSKRDALREQVDAMVRDARAVDRSRQRVSCAFWVDANRWEAAARDRGGTPNDLLIALVARVTSRLLERAGARAEETVVAMPVAGRDDSAMQKGGNVASSVHVRCPATTDPYDLPAMHARIKQALVESGTAPGRATLDPVVRLLPGRVQAAVTLRQYSSEHAVASNLVLPVQMDLRGAPVEHLFALAPAIGIPISFAMTTYGGYVQLCSNVDPAGLDPDAAYEEIAAELTTLCGEAGTDLPRG